MTQQLSLKEYSEKAFAVRGNTKSHKEDLKKLGGKWNNNLKGGAGWIFSKKRLDSVNKYISSIEIINDQERRYERKKLKKELTAVLTTTITRQLIPKLTEKIRNEYKAQSRLSVDVFYNKHIPECVVNPVTKSTTQSVFEPNDYCDIPLTDETYTSPTYLYICILAITVFLMISVLVIEKFNMIHETTMNVVHASLQSLKWNVMSNITKTFKHNMLDTLNNTNQIWVNAQSYTNWTALH